MKTIRIPALLMILVLLLGLLSCEKKQGNDDPASTESSWTDSNEAASSATDAVSSENTDENGEILEWPKEFYMELDLINTYSKLVYDKKLTVAYLGGSVTAGAFASDYSKCWAGLSATWLRGCYPEAQIRTIDAGWGGTGIKWGCYRLEEEVISQNADLVFVEFAINDYYDGTNPDDVVAYAESLIRKLYANNPTTEVVFVLVSEKTTHANQKQREAYLQVAEAYHIPVVDISTALSDYLKSEHKEWEELIADVVHPNDTGYAFYAEQVEAVLSEIFQTNSESIFERTVYHRPLPEITLSTRDFTGAHLLKAQDIDLTGCNGFQLTNDSNCRFKQYLTGSTGAELNLTFTGTDIGMIFWRDLSCGMIEYSIDGGESQTLDVSGQNDDGRTILFSNLENSTHTLTIRVTDKAVKLQAYTINGISE